MNIKKSHTTLPLALLVAILSSASCAIHTGTFGVGNPMALPPTESSNSLESYANYVKGKMSAKAKDTSGKDTEVDLLDPLLTNRTTRIEYAKAFSGDVKAAPKGLGGAAATATASATLPTTNAIFINETAEKPNGLLMDKISSIESFAAHKQRFIDLTSLYAHQRLYKVFFTLWVDPERQDLPTYLWRWASFHGFRNYTKDYHADIKFHIMTPGARVVRLEPEHEGSISDDYAVMVNQSQLGISGAWQDIAAKVDLAERLRQAEVEQRKYPILRSVIETETYDEKNPTDEKIDFHYIVSPRQHVEKRGFRIPLLMSTYTVTRRIELVPYNVSAYFSVPVGEPDLTLSVSACYKQYGKPEKDCADNNVRLNPKEKAPKILKIKIALPSDQAG